MLSASSTAVVRRTLLFALVALCGALVGLLLSYYPTMRDDLLFLHQARVAAEYQMLVQRQQQQQQQANTPVVVSPGTIAPSSSKPIEPPPKAEKK